MPTTWNPSDKTANGTLSGGNLTFTTTSFCGVRTTDRLITGKYYWECTLSTWNLSQTFVGVANAAADLSTVYGTTANASGIQRLNGQVWVNGSSTGLPQFGTQASGAVVCIALDCDNKLIWYRIGAAGNWNNNAGAAPGGTGGISIASISPDSRMWPLYGVAFSNSSGDVIVANFGASAFVGAVPAGYTSGFPSPSAPTLYAAATQVGLEQWASPNPAARATQVAAEVWTSTTATSGLAIVTQLGLEQWVVVPAVVVAARQYAVSVIS